MGMRVNEARRHHFPRGIHLFSGALMNTAQRHDPAILYTHIPDESRQSGTVDNRAIVENEIVLSSFSEACYCQTDQCGTYLQHQMKSLITTRL